MNIRKNPQRVLVTGGGGFLGSGIVGRLVAEGNFVRSLARSFYPKLQVWGVEQIQGDVADRASVQHACRDIELVFHTAAKPGVWGPYEAYYPTNALGTYNVIDACQKFNVGRLVYTSTPSVVFGGQDLAGVDESVPYPKRFHGPYPQTKALAEQAVVAAGTQRLKTIALRPHLIWGPGDNHLVPRILARANRLVQVGDGQNLIDTIYIDNAVDAHLLAADALKDHPELSGRVYFISNDEPLPLWEIVNRILEAGGYPRIKRSIPKTLAWCVGACLEFFYKLLHISSEPEMTRFVARELATAHWFDIGAARRDIGYHPRISMDEGFRRLRKWLQTNTKEHQ